MTSWLWHKSLLHNLHVTVKHIEFEANNIDIRHVVLFAVEWRQEELMRINETLSGAERKAALCMLLDQETQFLASIGRHKLEADAENREKFIQDFLEAVGTKPNCS